MDIDNLTPKSLADSLYKKHESLVDRHSRELKNLDRINLLEEKLDQLKYWIKEHKSDKNIDKYLKEKSSAEEELENLRKSVDLKSYKKRDSLMEKIKIHTNAMNYWKKVFEEDGAISQ